VGQSASIRDKARTWAGQGKPDSPAIATDGGEQPPVRTHDLAGAASPDRSQACLRDHGRSRRRMDVMKTTNAAAPFRALAIASGHSIQVPEYIARAASRAGARWAAAMSPERRIT
jgi:hypothetical protein